MNLYKYFSIVLALTFASPVFAAEQIVSNYSASVTSKSLFPGKSTFESVDLDLTSGTYTFSAAANAFATTLNGYSGVFSYLLEYAKDGSSFEYLGGVGTTATPATGLETDSTTFSFTVNDLANKAYALQSFLYANGGSASLSTSLSKAVAVPGPEAGTGLAALALAGVASLAYRRKRLAA